MAIILFLLALSSGVMLVTGRLARLATGEASGQEKINTALFLVALPACGVILNMSAPDYRFGLIAAGLGIGFSTTLVFSLNRGIWALLLEPSLVVLLYALGYFASASQGFDPVWVVEDRLARLGHPITSAFVGFLSLGLAGGIAVGVAMRTVGKFAVMLFQRFRGGPPASKPAKTTSASKRGFGRSKSQKQLAERVARLT